MPPSCHGLAAQTAGAGVGGLGVAGGGVVGGDGAQRGREGRERLVPRGRRRELRRQRLGVVTQGFWVVRVSVALVGMAIVLISVGV